MYVNPLKALTLGAIFLVLLPLSEGNAQRRASSQYPFIKEHLNSIGNRKKGMTTFYDRLGALDRGESNKLTIVHIGDSHIQADLFTGEVRKALHRKFGAAGRGLVFPYSVARTTSPGDIYSSSPNAWESKRNVFPDRPLPIGLSGITMKTMTGDFLLKLGVQSQSDIDYRFNYVTVFSDKGKGNYDMCVRYTPKGEDSEYYIDNQSDTYSRFSTSVVLDSLVRKIYIKGIESGDDQNQAVIYGVVLENLYARGIMYHTIGVNGAKYSHYNQSEHFLTQFSELNPDLVIISLGTNEALSGDFRPNSFFTEASTFIQNIKNYAPSASILLTIPPDRYKSSRYPKSNAYITQVKEQLVNCAGQYNVGFWDFFSIMGGAGSIDKWYNAGIAQKDKVHLNRKGYKIQGELLYDALMKGYERHKLEE